MLSIKPLIHKAGLFPGGGWYVERGFLGPGLQATPAPVCECPVLREDWGIFFGKLRDTPKLGSDGTCWIPWGEFWVS